ncbi:ATP-binding cassette domain-containing protein [Enterococcus sp. AD013-P3]|uniref:ABC transporter ATP-binding protein n=1 Tax=Enterococcus sp. AD013-P3 TaxID=3411036 RepID=UPI003B946AFE
MNAITLRDVTKSFGQKTILEGLNLTVPQGSIFGFVGENGAGKTTTMKLLLGLLPPDSGKITILGEPVRMGGSSTNRNIGYLPDVPSFYSYMRATEYLRLCGEITGMDPQQISKRTKELLQLVGLSNVNKKIGGYSRGMKQRLGLAQALLNEPAILICDEPTSALDPIGRRAFLDIFAGLRQKTTVLFSTHILNDVEAICDHVALLHKGQIQLAGPLDEIKQSYGAFQYEVIFTEVSACEKLAVALQVQTDLPGSVKTSGESLTISVSQPETEGRKLLNLIEQLALLPRSFRLVEPDLEQIFLKVVANS